MRKIYKMAGFICLGLVLSSQNTNAQTVSDFEGLTLSSNSFWDGSDMSGTHNNGLFTSTFMSGDAIYPNVYDTSFSLAFGFWSTGFAYSNMTDSTTSGSGNLYSARTAEGVNGSSNYVIANTSNQCIVNLTGAAANNTVSGVYITNGTYPAISMRDGDAFAKQFGGASGNDPDWFKLTIWGYTGGNLTTDSVEFYLADYRFTNNAQDYIVKDWNWVDLTPLGTIDSVIFVLTSSDNGAFGMNTPSFFALDNFNDQTVSVSELIAETNFSVYPNPTKNNVSIKLENDVRLLQIIDVTGKVIITQSNIAKGIHSLDLRDLNNGIYFIKIIANRQVKVERIIKQ
ncbi:MAG: hypothetical protein COA97_10860 [Flavobacteriales bacterium]|nr:MAG: hypothetical protein COA97_10860 [Flavobacteriales bacterium]